MEKKEEQTKKYEMDMCSGSILKKMLIFAVPLMCSGVLQLLFNAADIVVVGQFAGSNSLAAVGANTSLINLLTNLFLGMSIGANVLVARYYGAGQQSQLSKTVHTAIVLSIGSGVILTFLGIFGAKQILIWMQTPAEVLDLAVLYLRIYFIGMTGTMLYNFGAAILRAVGDTKRPLYYLMGAGVVNVILNLIFVIGLKMDVAGVAAATAIAECIAATLVIRCLMREQSGIRLIPGNLRIDRASFIKILQIGLPAGFQGVIFSLSNVVIQSSINLFGPVVVAGNSASANIEGFIYIAMNALHQATISFTSQNLGAGQYKRLDRIVVTGEVCVLVVGLVLGSLTVFFGNSLLGIYSSSPEVIQAGMQRLLVICTAYAICGMMDVMVGALRGIGYSVVPMVISLIGACGLRLLWIATVFQIPQYHSPSVIYYSYPITWAITLAALIGCYVYLRRKMNQKITYTAYQSAGKTLA